ncbi:hypothetical protein BU16DRAFT_567106 [Lophium mytilinum]|uniref:BTB domain-containing protein n=1 Tax=Lophium mytilinum TaxID=390894 RepID=A0A6A6QDB3_9PEZI|nr:hypothetical protein BU16DRAFT_567106 [Lophium mytilinum]
MFKNITDRLPAVPELPELPQLPGLATLRLSDSASRAPISSLVPPKHPLLQRSKMSGDPEELRDWDQVEEKWEDSDVEELLETAKHLPLDSPDARKEMDYFGSNDDQNHINMQRRIARVRARLEADKKGAVLDRNSLFFRKIPKPPPVPLDPEWEDEKDKEDFEESNFMYCRPSMKKEFEDYHGTPYASEALKWDKERREQKRRVEVVKIQVQRMKADLERKQRENVDFARPLLDALEKERKEKAEAEWLLVGPMDAEALRLEMQGRKDLELVIENEVPSYEASIEGRGEAGPEAPQHSMIDFEPTLPSHASARMIIKSIESTAVEELKDLIDPEGPQVELIFNASDQKPSPLRFPKLLLGAFSPVFRAHFAQRNVSHEITYLHLTGIEHATFMLLYRWMHMVCIGKWTSSSHRPKPYDCDDTLFPLPELGANQSFVTQIKLYCALNQLEVHLPKIQLRDLLRTRFPVPDGPILTTSLGNNPAPDSFPADDIKLVLNAVKLKHPRRAVSVSHVSDKKRREQVICNHELEDDMEEPDEIDYFLHTHIARYVHFLQAFGLFKKEFTLFVKENPAIAGPFARNVKKLKQLNRNIKVWQKQVPDDVAEMEVEKGLEILDGKIGGEVGAYRMEREPKADEDEMGMPWGWRDGRGTGKVKEGPVGNGKGKPSGR